MSDDQNLLDEEHSVFPATYQDGTLPGVLRFQKDDAEVSETWVARGDGFDVSFYVSKDIIQEVTINGFNVLFEPPCEGALKNCKCYYYDDDDTAEGDCPWAKPVKNWNGYNIFYPKFNFKEEIQLNDMMDELTNMSHPEFGAPSSIQDVASFEWVIMDKKNGVRTIWKGGQIKRPEANPAHSIDFVCE